MSSRTGGGWTWAAVAIGCVAATAFTLAPLGVVTLAVMPLIAAWATRLLPRPEARAIWTVVAVAAGLRLLLVAALFATGDFDTQGARILVPDEAYTLSRTLRIRNVIFDIPALKYDHIIAFEDYGRTSYLWVVTALQLLVGPSPYGLRLVNTLLFVAAALLLHRMARAAFGPTVATGGLAALVLLPTWLFWSVSLLKESLYFVLATITLTGVWGAIRGTGWVGRAGLLMAAVAAALALRDLRGGAIWLVTSGVLFGLVLYVVTVSRRVFVAALVVAVLATGAALSRPSVQSRIVTGLEAAARQHAGHVFTVGHPYKLLDEGFYVTLDQVPSLTLDEAARYVLRAAVSFVVVPTPAQMTNRELAQLPEHLLWLLIVVLAPVGLAAGLSRDRLVTCLLIGFALPTAVVVALTNGNVGTLIRFRGLVTPYLVWLAALGFCVIIERLARAARSRVATSSPMSTPPLEAPLA